MWVGFYAANINSFLYKGRCWNATVPVVWTCDKMKEWKAISWSLEELYAHIKVESPV